jgi:hypothetical protein
MRQERGGRKNKSGREEAVEFKVEGHYRSALCSTLRLAYLSFAVLHGTSLGGRIYTDYLAAKISVGFQPGW